MQRKFRLSPHSTVFGLPRQPVSAKGLAETRSKILHTQTPGSRSGDASLTPLSDVDSSAHPQCPKLMGVLLYRTGRYEANRMSASTQKHTRAAHTARPQSDRDPSDCYLRYSSHTLGRGFECTVACDTLLGRRPCAAACRRIVKYP